MAKSIAHTKEKKGWLRNSLCLLAKITLVLLAMVVFYAIYLDSQIRTRIDGKVWQLPAAIYGRMINLEPEMVYSQKEMIALLRGTQYRKVDQVRHSGEFSVGKNSIELMRRAFDFPDAKEESIHAQLSFNNSRLTRIQNLDSGRDFGFFRLDPKLITMLQSPKGEQRLFVAREGFSPTLIEALLATEDRYFYTHDGINPFAIGRAILANINAGKAVQGGSTLTQQLVKNIFLTNERSLERKVREALMALILDYRYSKERILELYLNEVYLGQSGKGGKGGDQIRGFPLGSIYYFGRPINELSLEQEAMLVAMIKGAFLYNPWKNPELVMQRRNLVLQLLLEQKFITEAEYVFYSAKPLGLQSEGAVITPQPAFVQLVLQELSSNLGDKMNDLAGVKIFTTLDPVSQSATERAIEEGIFALRNSQKINDLEASMVVVDRLSGEIRAMVGSSAPKFAGFNRALSARRPIGSLAKPATYLTALSQPEKYQLNTWLQDEPLTVTMSSKDHWQPQNYDRKFRGPIMLIDSLAYSINIPTVNLGLEIGLSAISDTLEKLGIAKKEIKEVPAMLLGSTSLTPIEVAQMYQVIGSGGHRAPLSTLRSIIGEDGSVHYQSYPQSRLVVSPQATYLTLYAMQQVVERGTSRSLNAKFGQYHLAAKTGTTNDLRDSWFAGIDGKEVVVAWVGRDNNKSANLTGSNGALTLFRRYLENQTPLPLVLQPPDGINMMGLDKEGYFTCLFRERTLPAWISDPQVFCQLSEQQKEQQQNQARVDNSFGSWLRDLFS